MTASRRQNGARRERPADLPNAILTDAEARGEAAYLVLTKLLPHLPASMVRRVRAEAYIAADDAAVEAITAELDNLFD